MRLEESRSHGWRVTMQVLAFFVMPQEMDLEPTVRATDGWWKWGWWMPLEQCTATSTVAINTALGMHDRADGPAIGSIACRVCRS